MSGLTEHEIKSKHVQSLKEARDSCLWLAQNADPDKVAPRGRHYGNLKRALNALEGSCRQLAAFRGDTRWTRLGFVYARAMRAAQANMTRQNWVGFKELSELFVLGLRRMDEIANSRTGKVGLILPSRPADWTRMPNLPIPGSRPRLLN